MFRWLQIGSLIEPAPVKFTFTAPGWQLLGLFLLLSALLALSLWLRHYQKNKYRREALAFLARHAAQDAVSLLYTADVLMKRIAADCYGRDTVAGLRGAGWINFLNTTCKSALFAEEDLRLLDQLYTGREISGPAINDFIAKTNCWINTHKRINFNVHS